MADKEIKFELIREDGGKQIISFLHENRSIFQETGFSQIEYPKCKAFRQFTGLRDKNGTEIYEGDIVKVGTGMKPDVVEWGDGSYEGYYGYTGITLRDGFEADTDSSGAKEWEVIGNIYENPELIK